MNPKGIPPHYVRDAQGNYSHPSRVMGGPLSTVTQQDPVPALDQKPQAYRGGQKRVAVRVEIIRLGRKLLDSDNLAFANKGLRDAVAKSFGCDDADPRIKWEYGQVRTMGRTGTIVRMELV